MRQERGTRESPQEEHSSGSIKSITITKLFDGFMD